MPDVGVVVRGIDDTGVVAVDVIVEPDVVRDEIEGGVSTGGVGAGLGGSGGGGDGKRVAGGGGESEAGTSKTSPALPSIKGDSARGGDDGSIRVLFRRGEPARNGEALRNGVAEGITLVGVEDV